MSLILIIVVLLLLFGGGGGYYGYSRYGGRGAGGIVGTVPIVLLVVWLLGGIAILPFLTSDLPARHHEVQAALSILSCRMRLISVP